MTSVNTNVAAITALRTLQQTNSQLDATQGRISTGLKIGEAKDNAAYWAISTTLKSDNKALSTVKDALGLGSATVDVAYQGLTKAKDVLDEIKSKLTAASQAGVDKNVIQAEIGELQKQLVSIAGSSVFSGENWLSVDSSAVDYDATKKIVASFARDTNNSVTIGTVDVAIGNVALFDSSTVVGKNGILDGMQNLKNKDGTDLKIGGTASTTGNGDKAGLDVAGAAGKTDGTLTAGSGTTTVGRVASVGSTTVAGQAATSPSYTMTGSFGITAGSTPAGTDELKFTIKIGAVTKAFTILGSAGTGAGTGVEKITLADMVSVINGGAQGFGATVAADTGGRLTLSSATTGAASTIDVSAISTQRTGGGAITPTAPVITGLTTVDSTTAVGAKGADATSGVVTTGALSIASTTGIADGDKLSFTIDDNGTAKSLTLTYKASGASTAAGEFGTAAEIVTALNATKANAKKVSDGTTSALTATVSGNAAGLTLTSAAGANTVQILDVKLTDGTVAARQKNLNGVVATGTSTSAFTVSKVGEINTGALTLTGLGTTDKLTFGFSIDGAALPSVSVAKGAGLTDIVTALNANSDFNTKANAFVLNGNQLVVTSKNTGVASAVSLDSVSFSTSTGAAKNVASTGFTNVGTAGTAQTTAFPAAGITLDDNDSISFSIAVDGATTGKTVTINQALVNKTLTVGPRTVTDGKIANAADYKAVMDKALLAAGVTNVTTSLTGANSDQLTFSSKTVSTTSKVVITAADASQGANQMSVDKLDISDAGFAKLNVTSGDDVSKVLSAYIAVVNNAINSVTTAASNLGAVASRIDMQKSFVNTLMDTIDKGVGGLIDADMSEESTKLQALQVKQSLGVQALSIANQSSQNILRLFQ